MRRLLNFLYDACAWLAALCMIGVLVMVLLSILGRQVPLPRARHGCLRRLLHGRLGLLALAHTLKKGEHIRVTLLLSHLHGSARRGLEIWALTAAVLIAGLFAWFSVRLAWQSHAFNDISTGNDATPLWIPQLSMALGAVVLLIAFIDEWVQELRGQRSHEQPAELLRNE